MIYEEREKIEFYGLKLNVRLTRAMKLEWNFIERIRISSAYIYQLILVTYSLCPFLIVVFGVRVISLTRFVENTYNIYIFK